MFGQLVTVLVTWMNGGREAATSNERTLGLIVHVAYTVFTRKSAAFRSKNVNKRCFHPATMWRLLIFDTVNAERLIRLILLLLLLLFIWMWKGIKTFKTNYLLRSSYVIVMNKTKI